MIDLENENDDSKIFVAATSGPERFSAFFDEDDHGGYLYISDREADRIVRDLRIYDNSEVLHVEESDVHVLWSSDGTKCGVVIWGRMRGIINIANEQEVSAPLESRGSPAISDPEWLRGFDTYLDETQFIRARQRYWKEMIKEHEPGTQPLPEDQTPIQTNFILYASGPNKTFAVFEDDGESGYLFLYSSEEQTVLRFLHVYDRSPRLDVAHEDVQVMWAARETKCGVAIWGKMRGIIDLASGGEGRVWMESRDTPGIGDQKWLEGF
jgi:hypothetical protein